MLKQQSSITGHRLPTKENKQTSVFRFRLQKTNRNCRFPLVPNYFVVRVCVCVCVSMYIFISVYLTFRTENGHQGNPLTVCPSCKRKFVRLLTKKQTEVSVRIRNKWTCPSIDVANFRLRCTTTVEI
jgi:hypothetical protein